jgi:hypothetical protein
MNRMPRILLLAGCVGAMSAAASGAQAQDSNVSFQSGLLVKPPKPGLPDVKPQPQAWPRLDAGSVACRTEADLDRLALRRRGEDPGGPVDCQVIRDATAISIVARKGPGRTEVKISAQPTSPPVWTDAWLPEKAPAGVKSATASAAR